MLIIGWTFIAALSAGALAAWITIVNLLYLLIQIALAVEGVGLSEAYRAVARFIYAEFRELAGVFAVDCNDLERAIQIAGPISQHGVVEIRPLMDAAGGEEM